MAITHCSVKNGRAGKGAAHALYVQGVGRYAERDDVAFIEHGNMPTFASHDPQHFWRAADANERANGRPYREIEFAIPRELETEKEQIKFAQRFTDKVVGVGHAYTLAIHDKAAADGGRNVHAHLMFTERKNDGIERDAVQFFKRANSKQPEKGGAAKDRTFNSREFVKSTRALYEKVVNRELEVCGAAPISMARNDSIEPEPKLGPRHKRAEPNMYRETRLEVVAVLRAARAEAQQLERHAPLLESAIFDLSNSVRAALAEREQAVAAIRERQRAASPITTTAAVSRANPLSGPLEARRRSAVLAAEAKQGSAASEKAADRDVQLAHSLKTAVDGLSQMGFKVSSSPVNLDHGQYSGKVLLVTDFHVAQDWGRREAVLHDRERLKGDYQPGESVMIRYDSGRGLSTRKLDRELSRNRRTRH